MHYDIARPEVLKSQAMIRYQMKTAFGFDVVRIDEDKRQVPMLDFWHEAWQSSPGFEIENSVEGMIPIIESVLDCAIRDGVPLRFYVMNDFSHYADWFLFGGRLAKRADFRVFLDTFGSYRIISESLSACSFDRSDDRLYCRTRIAK